MSLFRKVMKAQKRQFVVLGLGRFGRNLALTLIESGHEVLGIDMREEVVQDLADELTHCVVADVTDESALKSLGLRNFDVAVVGIRDLEPSILATMVLKELGIPHVVAKATGDLHGKLLAKVGADRVVYPERDMGVRLAHNLVNVNLIDYLELAPGYRIFEVKANQQLVGRSLTELDLRAKYGINVLVIKRGTRIMVSPNAQEAIQEGDILVAMAPEDAFDRFDATSGPEIR